MTMPRCGQSSDAAPHSGLCRAWMLKLMYLSLLMPKRYGSDLLAAAIFVDVVHLVRRVGFSVES